jgi:hypothetical protein
MSTGSFRQSGWVWEGVATHAGVWPTIYGVGEGARHFDLDGVWFMFHPNTPVNLAKLADVPRVVCDISKWVFEHVGEPGAEVGFKGVHHGDPATILAEAENLSRLSLQFPNIVGGVIDDLTCAVSQGGLHRDAVADVAAALKSANPRLELQVVAYTHELDQPLWGEIAEFVDVVTLWLWNCQEIPELAQHVAHCARVFGDVPIVMGSYLRDFPSRAGVPLRLLERQYETMLRLWEQGDLQGFSLLGAFLIDQDVPQAEWVREFLRAH